MFRDEECSMLGLMVGVGGGGGGVVFFFFFFFFKKKKNQNILCLRGGGGGGGGGGISFNCFLCKRLGGDASYKLDGHNYNR